MMGKRDRVKQGFKNLCHPLKASAYESAPNTARTVLEPRVVGPRLNEPADTADGVSSADGVSLAGDRSQDAPVKDLWGLALAEISSEDNEVMSQITLDSKLDILRHLQTAAVKKRIDCEDKRWRIEVNGRQIILCDVAEKIFAWIERFKQIGDIAVNFDLHVSLPQAGIRFLLEVGLISYNTVRESPDQD